jgi:hypothetical protein
MFVTSARMREIANCWTPAAIARQDYVVPRIHNTLNLRNEQISEKWAPLSGSKLYL